MVPIPFNYDHVRAGYLQRTTSNPSQFISCSSSSSPSPETRSLEAWRWESSCCFMKPQLAMRREEEEEKKVEGGEED